MSETRTTCDVCNTHWSDVDVLADGGCASCLSKILRDCEAVCYCGIPLSQHSVLENHMAVGAEHPCPHEATVLQQQAEIERLTEHSDALLSANEVLGVKLARQGADLAECRRLLRELRDCVADWEISPAHEECGCATCGEIKALAAKAGGDDE